MEISTISGPMDNFRTGVITATRAGVKTGKAAVYLAELEQQNLFIAFGQFSGPVTKR